MNGTNSRCSLTLMPSPEKADFWESPPAAIRTGQNVGRYRQVPTTLYRPLLAVDVGRWHLELSEKGTGISDDGGEDAAPPPLTPPTPHETGFARRPDQPLHSQRSMSEAPCPQSLRGSDSLDLSDEHPGRGGGSELFGL